MTDKEKIRKEIERLIRYLGEQRDVNLEDLCDFIDSLPEVSEDLEEASRNYADNEEYGDDVYFAIKAAFKAGANWQKDEDTRDMFMSDNRNFKKVYDIGKKDMKEQMMKDAVDVYVCTNLDKTRKIPCSTEWGGRIPWNAIFENRNVGDKVKLIIVKED